MLIFQIPATISKEKIFNIPHQEVDQNEQEEIDQEQEDFSGGFEKLYGDINLIQSFKPARDTITRAELYLSKCSIHGNSLNDIVVSIRESIYGRDLTSCSVSSNAGSSCSKSRKFL